jgi:hypothetical protein
VEPPATFAAWIAALAHPHDRAALVAAVDDAIHVERHAWVFRDREPGPPAEIFDGVDAVERWLRRLPAGVTFTLVGDPVAVGDAWQIEYALAIADFRGGGVWRARLADDGRVRALSHRPFPLRPEDGGPAVDAAGSASPTSAEPTCAHDHHHDHHR